MNLTYEKAKELKEAGFPQEVRDGILSDKGIPTEDKWSGVVYIPTLEELIVACGDRFSRVLQCFEPRGWQAVTTDIGESIRAEGSTPEEAVANLWLELNKK